MMLAQEDIIIALETIISQQRDFSSQRITGFQRLCKGALPDTFY
jgi:hypothetical protein